MSENTRAVRSYFQKTPGGWVSMNPYKYTTESMAVDETNWQRLWASWGMDKRIREEWSSKEKEIAWVLVPNSMNKSFGSVVCSRFGSVVCSRLFSFSTSKKSGWGQFDVHYWLVPGKRRLGHQLWQVASGSSVPEVLLLGSFGQKRRIQALSFLKGGRNGEENAITALGCLGVRRLGSR